MCAVALHVLRETLTLAHPVIPFVTEEIWSYLPGSDGLLMVAPWPAPDDALLDEAAEAELARAIAAVQELRAWRDRVGAAPGRALEARLEASGYERTADAVARLARVEWTENGTAPIATVPVPGGNVAVLESDAVDTEAEAKRAAAERAAARQRDQAVGGQARQRGLRGEGPAARGPGRARQARAAAGGAGGAAVMHGPGPARRRDL